VKALLRKKSYGFATELLITVVIVLAATLLIRVYIVQARVVPTESMEPTVQPGDRVLVDRFLYRLTPLRRGDIIMFEPPARAQISNMQLSDYLKRVIGLPGDSVAIHSGSIHINGRLLREPYLANHWNGDYDGVVPADSYFVMGDNRCNSFDSRYWGPVPQSRVEGRAVAIYWPLDHARWLVPTSEFAVNAAALVVVLTFTLSLSKATEELLN
jgi:signal peptidase I